jgi:NADPH-dependent glutamate synthase beta subunit-like oxidoreductase
MLEETLGIGNVKKVNDIIRRAIKKLEKTGFKISRE